MFLLSASVHAEFSATIVNLGVIVLAGLIMGRIVERFKIPAVTGYLIAGLILGPISGYLSIEELGVMSIVGDISLGFIAFQVGNELWFGKLKKSGSKIVIITITQALITTGVVILATSFKVNISIALVLGAVAAATAPAPIMMIIKKYRTKGELTDTILPVVGLDDAVGVIMFGVLLSIAVSLAGSGTESLSFLTMFVHPLVEIGKSIGIGLGIGAISGLTKNTFLTLANDKRKI